MYALINLDSYSKDVHTEEKYHEINNNTLNRSNIKDVTTDIYNTQYGNRVQGRAYNLQNHYNGGYESFGLQNLATLDQILGAVDKGSQLGGAIWQAADPKSFDKNGANVMD